MTLMKRFRERFKVPDEIRFWQYVDSETPFGPDGTCWSCSLAIQSNGYHLFTIYAYPKRIPIHAHRYIFALERYPIPPEKEIRHLCGNCRCVNPWHMIPGTRKENAQDRGYHGRTARGEDHYEKKLTEEKVRQIRAAMGKTQRALAEEFGVNQALIWRILHRKVWTHI